MVILNNFLVILQMKRKFKKGRLKKMNQFDSKAGINIFYAEERARPILRL